MSEQTGRDAAVEVIGKAIVAPQMLAFGFDADDARLAAPHIADALAAAGLLRTTPEPPGDVVEMVARAICNTGQSTDLWASDELEWSTRDDLLAEARAAIAAMPQPAVTREQVRMMAIEFHDQDCGGPYTGMHHDDHWKAWASGVERALWQAEIHVQDGER